MPGTGKRGRPRKEPAMETRERKSSVWSTKRVDEWLRLNAEGYKQQDNPWLDGQVGLRRPNLTFEYTDEEVAELVKCAKDIIYFADNYCYCMQGSKGYQPITLRDYQKDMLESYANNRFSICCSSRQVGKCHIASKMNVLQTNKISHKYIEDLYYERKNKGFLSHVKSLLLKIYRKL